MVAPNCFQHISDPARYHVVMDELNDLEMGKILGACDHRRYALALRHYLNELCHPGDCHQP